MKNIISKLLFFFLLTLSLSVNAQDDVAMADGFRADGKIYVVIVVFAIILTGLFVYVFLLDRKIGKLEREEKN
ncbi:MAG TPA: CcmD family protein [Cytophagaceae bacterium]|jgi:CcmD family protein|nr:CcmD family protein [Cytophagaceae bacterium]